MVSHATISCPFLWILEVVAQHNSGLVSNWMDSHIRWHGGYQHLLHEDSPLVYNKALCWILLMFSLFICSINKVKSSYDLSLSYHCYADDTELILIIYPSHLISLNCCSHAGSSFASGVSGHFCPHRPLKCFFSPLSVAGLPLHAQSSHIPPHFLSFFHWLPGVAWIRFKTINVFNKANAF